MNKPVNKANLGMGLETLINHANEQYASRGIANIKKVSTPWKVVWSRGKIIDAFPEGESTVDYMGDFGGRSICFEAKSCEEKTSFPLKNFKPHQIEFMRRWCGYRFALIEMAAHRTIRLLPIRTLFEWYDGEHGRKSIPINVLLDLPEVTASDGIVLDYLRMWR